MNYICNTSSAKSFKYFSLTFQFMREYFIESETIASNKNSMYHIFSSLCSITFFFSFCFITSLLHAEKNSSYLNTAP